MERGFAATCINSTLYALSELHEYTIYQVSSNEPALYGCDTIFVFKEGRISLGENIHVTVFKITDQVTLKKKPAKSKTACCRQNLQQEAADLD